MDEVRREAKQREVEQVVLRPPTLSRYLEETLKLPTQFSTWRAENVCSGIHLHHFLALTCPGKRRTLVGNSNAELREVASRRPFSFQPGKELPMFTRVVEVTAKSGKAQELANTIQEKVLPILQKQTGFLDETVLTSDTESNRVVGISFWNTKQDAERYHREQYPKVSEMLSPLFETAPVIRTYNVHTSTSHKIAAGKAA